jgi:hypothetical protein
MRPKSFTNRDGLSICDSIAAEAYRTSPRQAGLSPQLLKPRRICSRVPDGVLNIPVAEIILNEPGVGSLVGERKAASMAHYVGMGREGQGGCLAACIQNQIDGRAVQGQASDTRKPCRNIRNNRQRSRASLRVPRVAAISLPTSSPVRWLRPALPRSALPALAARRPVFFFLAGFRGAGIFIVLSRVPREKSA